LTTSAGPAAKPPLISGASRAAGAVGAVTSIVYLVLVISEGDSEVWAWLGWFAVMMSASILAWFADRKASPRVGRRMVWIAFLTFFVVGVLSIFTIGVLFLIAAVLAVFSLSRSVAADPDKRVTQ
jgi:hypothetical protein